MGGFSVVVMLSVLGAVAFVILGVVAVAFGLFVAATVVSIVFACRTKTRRERGKRLGGLVAVPIALYAVSVPVLVWFVLMWVVPIAGDGEGDELSDFSQAITRHEPEALQACFDADAFSFPSEGPESLASLLEVAIAYGEAPCAQTVLAAAEKRGAPLDVNEPLPSYTVSGDPYGAERPLARAAGSDYSSARMLSVLLEAGADPNAASLLDVEGGRPLHLVCDNVGWTSMSAEDQERALADSGESIDLLAAYGADPAAVDAAGLTAGDRLTGRLDSLVEGDALTREQANRFVAEHAESLGLAYSSARTALRAAA